MVVVYLIGFLSPRTCIDEWQNHSHLNVNQFVGGSILILFVLFPSFDELLQIQQRTESLASIILIPYLFVYNMLCANECIEWPAFYLSGAIVFVQRWEYINAFFLYVCLSLCVVWKRTARLIFSLPRCRSNRKIKRKLTVLISHIRTLMLQHRNIFGFLFFVCHSTVRI